MNAFEKLRQRGIHFITGKSGCISFGNDVDVPSPEDHGSHPAEIFAYQAFDSVAHDSVTDFPAHRNTNSRILPTGPGIQKDEMPVLNFGSALRQANELRAF